MSKLVKLSILAAVVALTAASCKKDEGEFPKQTLANGTYSEFEYTSPTLPSISDADGILAAVDAHNYRIITLSPFEQQYQYGMTAFANTTGNFSSLSNGGTVTIDNNTLTANGSMLYQSNATTYSIGLSGANAWNVTGNGSVPAMTYTTPTGLPQWTLFSNPASNISYWKDEWVPTYPRKLTKPAVVLPGASGYAQYQVDSTKFVTDSTWNETVYLSIPLKDYVSGADTVAVYWHDDAGFSFEKKFAATDSLATFKPNDFLNLPTYSINSDLMMEYNLIKYNSVSVSGKKYYYIKMATHMKYWRTE
jgi:hypothetical protein